jgi:hypothetical protein
MVKVSGQTAGTYISNIRDVYNVSEVMEEREGQVVKEYKVGNTHVKVLDDFYYTKTPEDVEAILVRIANKVQVLLSAQSTEIKGN